MDKANLYNENELLKKIAAGDEQAFGLFFDQYKHRFYAVALKMTASDEVAEEIVQETFIQIWRKRELLPGLENLSAYLFTIVYRKVYSYFRQLANDRDLIQAFALSQTGLTETADKVISNENRHLLHQAIRRLPPQQQLIFRLSKEEGLSRNDIADILKISPNTVKNHLGDALQSIRKYLKNMTLFCWLGI